MSKVFVDSDGQHFLATCESFSNRDIVGLVPGAKWRENRGHWEMPLTWASAKQLRSLLGEDLELSEAAIDWGYDEFTKRIQPCMMLRDLLNPGKPYPTGYDERLY